MGPIGVIKRCGWWLLAAILSQSPLPRALAGETRVALVATSENQHVKSVLALTEPPLSRLDSLVLIDRGEIRRVLAEHELALSGIADPEQAIQIGRLLRVDLFAILESDSRDANLLGLVVFDAATGVRLGDKAVGNGSVEVVAERVVSELRRAVAKQGGRSRTTHAIGLLTVRNADLPREMDSTVQAVGRLLERSLTRTPQLAVLERDRLRHVIQERRLATEEPLPPLLTSLFLVELEVGRGKTPKQLQAVARATNLAGKPLATWTATGNEPYSLVQQLRKNIELDLRLIPASDVVDRVREADRFSRESNLLREHQEFQRALLAAEAAFSLDPESTRRLRALVFRLWDAAVQLVDPGQQQRIAPPQKPIDFDKLAESIELARHGLAMQTELVRRLSAAPQWPANAHEAQIVTDQAYLSKIVHLDEQTPEASRALVRQLVDEYRKLQLLSLGEKLSRTADDEDGFRRYTSWVAAPALRDVFQRYAPIRDDWAADVWDLLTTWATIADKHHPSRHAQLHASSEFVLSTLSRGQALRQLNTSQYDLLRRTHEFLASRSDPLLRLYGKYLTLQLDQQAGRLPPDKLRRALEQLEIEIRAMIVAADQEVPPESRLHWVHFALETHQLVPWDDRLTLNQRLFQLALSQGIYSRQLFQATASGYRRLKTPQEHLQLIDETLEFLDSPACGLDEPDRRLETAGLQQQRQSVLKEMQQTLQTVTPWETVSTLIDVGGQATGVRAVLRPVVFERKVFALGMDWNLSGGQVRLTLLRLDVDTRTKVTRGTFVMDDLPVPPPGHNSAPEEGALDLPTVIERSTSSGSSFVRTALVAEGSYCAGTMGKGILIFPLQGGPPRRIDQQAGLPTNYVQAMTHSDGWIYAWLGKPGSAAYLVRLSLAGTDVSVIASSRRTVERSPLDNTSPVQCDMMLVDAPRKRIVFRLTDTGSDEKLGLWQLALDSHRLRQLERTHLFTGSNPPRSFADGTIFLKDRGDLYRFDLDANRLEHIYSYEGPAPWTFLPIARRGQDLWIAYPFGRIDLATNVTERFPDLREGTFQPATYFHQLSDREVLLGDPSGIWLLRLP